MSEKATAEKTVMPKHGEFCWIEIAVTSLEDSRNFYAEVFGWSFRQSENSGDDAPYLEFGIGGRNFSGADCFGGMYQINEQMFGGVFRPHFAAYIAADEVDRAASKVRDLGGEIVLQPVNIPNVGRLCVARDPDGAIFSMITLLEENFAGGLTKGTVAEPLHGEVCWRDLRTRNLERATEFYRGLFGWELNQAKRLFHEYLEINAGGRVCGGMIRINEDRGDLPSYWMNYIAVEDCGATVEKIRRNGGGITAGPLDIWRFGKIAEVSDPGGATFSIIQLYSK